MRVLVDLVLCGQRSTLFGTGESVEARSRLCVRKNELGKSRDVRIALARSAFTRSKVFLTWIDELSERGDIGSVSELSEYRRKVAVFNDSTRDRLGIPFLSRVLRGGDPFPLVSKSRKCEAAAA